MLHICSRHNQVLIGLMFYIIFIEFADLHPILCGLWAVTRSSLRVLLHFSFRYCMWGMKVIFLSKINSRNLYWSTTGISVPSNFSVGL